jgi:calcineurin-like phosphoesterase family protein
MTTFFTSNTQFLVTSGIGSEDLEQNIQAWNSQAGKNDTIYVVGNFISSQDRAEFIRVVDRLNGKIKLIYGPRDQRYDLSELIKETADLLPGKVSALGPYYTLSGNKAGTIDKVILSFWPMVRWEMQEFGAWHLHGGQPTANQLAYDIPRRITVDWTVNNRQFIRADSEGKLVVNS